MQSPLANIGLPETWQPTPLRWNFAKMEMEGPAGRQQLHIIMIDTPLGRAGYALTPADLQRFIDACTEQLSGLQVARIVPPNGKV